MPGTPRYRGLRRTANRAALLQAAEELFGASPFPAVSVDDIVARAGVAKGTFYNHFADKEDLAANLALTIRYAVRDRIGAIKTQSADPAMHLAIAVTLFLELALLQPNRALILVSLLTGATDTAAAMNSPLRATLEAGRDQGRFRIDNVELALLTVLGIVSAAIRGIIEHPPKDPRAAIIQFVMHTLAAMHFICPAKQLKIATNAANLVLPTCKN
jgi:AcrR family transcriptional regulator